MKWLLAILTLVLVLLQYRLWFGEGGLEEIARLDDRIAKQREINRVLMARNRQLEVEVYELQQGLDGIEEKARSELGMIKKGEVFYQLLDEPLPETAADSAPFEQSANERAP